MSTETEPRTPTENDGWWSVSGWGTLHQMKPKTYSVTHGETMWRTLCGRDAPSSHVHRETFGDGDRCGQCERRQTAQSGR